MEISMTGIALFGIGCFVLGFFAAFAIAVKMEKEDAERGYTLIGNKLYKLSQFEPPAGGAA